MCHKSTSWTSVYGHMWLTISDAEVLLTVHVFNPHMLLTITLVNDIFLREFFHILLRITLVNDILRKTSPILLRITLVNDIFLRETSHILLRITLVNDIFLREAPNILLRYFLLAETHLTSLRSRGEMVTSC